MRGPIEDVVTLPQPDRRRPGKMTIHAIKPPLHEVQHTGQLDQGCHQEFSGELRIFDAGRTAFQAANLAIENVFVYVRRFQKLAGLLDIFVIHINLLRGQGLGQEAKPLQFGIIVNHSGYPGLFQSVLDGNGPFGFPKGGDDSFSGFHNLTYTNSQTKLAEANIGAYPKHRFCQGPWNEDLRTPRGQECSNGSLLRVRRGHPGIP
jgi:hypothetical protein